MTEGLGPEEVARLRAENAESVRRIAEAKRRIEEATRVAEALGGEKRGRGMRERLRGLMGKRKEAGGETVHDAGDARQERERKKGLPRLKINLHPGAHPKKGEGRIKKILDAGKETIDMMGRGHARSWNPEGDRPFTPIPEREAGRQKDTVVARQDEEVEIKQSYLTGQEGDSKINNMDRRIGSEQGRAAARKSEEGDMPAGVDTEPAGPPVGETPPETEPLPEEEVGRIKSAIGGALMEPWETFSLEELQRYLEYLGEQIRWSRENKETDLNASLDTRAREVEAVLASSKDIATENAPSAQEERTVRRMREIEETLSVPWDKNWEKTANKLRSYQRWAQKNNRALAKKIEEKIEELVGRARTKGDDAKISFLIEDILQKPVGEYSSKDRAEHLLWLMQQLQHPKIEKFPKLKEKIEKRKRETTDKIAEEIKGWLKVNVAELSAEKRSEYIKWLQMQLNFPFMNDFPELKKEIESKLEEASGVLGKKPEVETIGREGGILDPTERKRIAIETLRQTISRIHNELEAIEARDQQIKKRLAELEEKAYSEVKEGKEKTFPNTFVEKKMKELLSAVEAVKEIKLVEVKGNANEIYITARLTSDKIKGEIGIELTLESDGNGIKYKYYKVDAPLVAKVFLNRKIGRELGLIEDRVRKYIESEENRKIKRVWIADGQLKVEFA